MCAMKRISTRSIKWRIRYNIHTIVKQGLRGTLCLTFMENLDYLDEETLAALNRKLGRGNDSFGFSDEKKGGIAL